MDISGLIDKTFRPYKGAVYRSGLAMPEPEYETATGRKLFTVSQVEKIAALAIEAERKECEKVCHKQTMKNGTASDCERAIRMRSND